MRYLRPWCLPVLCFTLLLPCFDMRWAEAGDNLELWSEDISGQELIHHRRWIGDALQLRWSLSERGVVDSDGITYISADDLWEVINTAFMAWEDVECSSLTVTGLNEAGRRIITPVSDTGFDLVNVVTWSDSYEPPTGETVAQGHTWSYTGTPLVLDASTREFSFNGNTVTLSEVDYPDDSILLPGTILDMDMTFNSTNPDIKYVLNPNSDAYEIDVQTVATHEAGHLFGLSHTSLAFDNDDPATMRPYLGYDDVESQVSRRSPGPDDRAGLGYWYPGPGYCPGGGVPADTGAISGRVIHPDDEPAGGVRVWAYHVNDTSQPKYETFTLSAWDAEVVPSSATREEGQYQFSGMEPGHYYICIVPWLNGFPEEVVDDPCFYNITTCEGAWFDLDTGNGYFHTEFFDDIIVASGTQDFSQIAPVEVEVLEGETSDGIDFVTDIITSTGP